MDDDVLRSQYEGEGDLASNSRAFRSLVFGVRLVLVLLLVLMARWLGAKEGSRL